MNVKELAKLARIEIGDTEADKLQADVSRILEYVAEVENAPVSETDEVKYDVRNVMRSDEVTNESGEYTDAIVGQAPKKHDGYVEVQQILEK